MTPNDAIRLARFELGIEITLDEDREFRCRQPGPGLRRPVRDTSRVHVLNTRIARGAVIRGTIKYPPAAGLGNSDTGMLVVAEAALWCELPDWVLTYGAGKGSDDFPHDKTSDQWFNEAEFATYTEIGRCIGKKAREVRPRDEETPAPDGSVGRLPEALEVGTSLRGTRRDVGRSLARARAIT